MQGFRWAALAAFAALTAAVLGACGGGTPEPAAPAAAEVPCDRACLDGLVDVYIEALIAHDPGKIPAAAGIRFVENGVELPLGTALWRTASGRGTYSHYFADVAAGQAGFIGTLREHGKGMIFVLRLAVRGRQIAEIEQLAIRTGNVDEYEKLQPDPLWSASVPEVARRPRAELIALADRYYTGMQRNDPKGDYSFFHGACQIFCVRAGCIDQSLKVKRSPNWIASCALAACHAIGGRFHFSVMWRRASQMSLVAA
jgi:hypothetical protein